MPEIINIWIRLNYFDLFNIKVWRKVPLIFQGFTYYIKEWNHHGHTASVTHFLLEKDYINTQKTYIWNKGLIFPLSVTLQCHFTGHFSSFTATQTWMNSSTISSDPSFILWGWFRYLLPFSIVSSMRYISFYIISVSLFVFPRGFSDF